MPPKTNIPSHYNLPNTSNINTIFETLLVCSNINKAIFKSEDIAIALNKSGSATSKVLRFFIVLNLVEKVKGRGYRLTQEGLTISRLLPSEEFSKIYNRLRTLLLKYIVTREIIIFLLKNGKNLKKTVIENIYNKLKLKNLELKSGIDVLIQLMLSCNIIEDDSKNNIFSTKKVYTDISGLNLTDALNENTTITTDLKDTISNDKQIILKKAKHYNLPVVGYEQIFQAILGFKGIKKPIKTNYLAKRISHGSSSTSKTIRFLIALKVIKKINKQYELTQKGKIILKYLTNNNQEKAFQKLIPSLISYKITKEITNLLKREGKITREFIIETVYKKLEISNIELKRGIDTVIELMLHCELAYTDANANVRLKSNKLLKELNFKKTKLKISTQTAKSKKTNTIHKLLRPNLSKQIKRRIKILFLNAFTNTNSEHLQEDTFSLLLEIAKKNTIISYFREDKTKALVLDLKVDQEDKFILGTMAIIKTSDLPSAASLPNKILSNSIVMEISKKDIQIRGLGLSNNEGVYFPVHFLIKKYGNFAVIVSESYQLGPQITSLQTILNNFEGTRKFTFEISFLLDRSKFQRLDTLNMALSFDVRIATQNWDNELTKLSEIKGLDKIINEVKQTSMNVNVSINYTTKKKGSLETIVGSLSSLKKLITLGRDKGAIQRAVLHSKDSNGYEELINLLYERITPNDFVFFALNDSRMVDEDFVYKTLKQTLLKNEEFILRALANENIN